MSRSGYSDDCDDAEGSFAMWRGQVASSIRGKRGQAFLRELLAAMDAMPEKALIPNDLYRDGDVCTLGVVGQKRGVDMTDLDPEDHHALSQTFNISRQLVMEIEYLNDEHGPRNETPEARWQRMRAWVVEEIKTEVSND